MNLLRNIHLTLRPYYRYAVAVLLIALICFAARNHLTDWKRIRDLRLITIFELMILFMILQFTLACMQKIILKVFHVQAGIQELFGLVCAQAFVNYLPLSAGIASTATWLKLRKGLPISNYVSIAGWLWLLAMGTHSMIGLLLVGVLYLRGVYLNPYIVYSLLSIILGAVVIVLLPLPHLTARHRVLRFYGSLREGWYHLRSFPTAIALLIVLNAVALFVTALRLYIIFQDFGKPMNLVAVIVLTVATTVMNFSFLLPGNLGMRETIAGTIAKAFNFTFADGLIAALVDRIVLMLWLFPVGAFCVLRMFKKQDMTEPRRDATRSISS